MAKQKRPPRQVWCAVNDDGAAVGVYAKRRQGEAAVLTALSNMRVVGPYVLAERAREK